ncbi:hypothetical protein Tco_0767764 [Tanacetum coccineum]
MADNRTMAQIARTADVPVYTAAATVTSARENVGVTPTSDVAGSSQLEIIRRFNVGAAWQICLELEVRSRTEHELKLKEKLKGKYDARHRLLEEKDLEILRLKSLLAEEAEKAERAETAEVSTLHGHLDGAPLCVVERPSCLLGIPDEWPLLSFLPMFAASGGRVLGPEIIAHSIRIILLLRNVTDPPSTGNFNIPCAVDGMAHIFLIPGLAIIPLCWDGDLTTMKLSMRSGMRNHLAFLLIQAGALSEHVHKGSLRMQSTSTYISVHNALLSQPQESLVFRSILVS